MDELGIKGLLHMYGRNKLILIIICVISVILGVIYTKTIKTPKYESTTQILFAKDIESAQENTSEIENNKDNKNTTNNTKNNSSNEVSSNTTESNMANFELTAKLLDTYIELIKSDVVIDKAIERIETQETIEKDEIINNLEVDKSSDLAAIIEIKSVSNSPTLARDISKNVSDVFLETIKEYYEMENAYIITEAKVANEPYNMNHKLDIIVFFVVGFAIASLIILIKTMYEYEH